MKKSLVSLLLLLTIAVSNLAAYEFYLQSKSVFTPEEPVFVQYYNYNYQNNTEIHFALYTVSERKDFFENYLFQNNYYIKIPDSVLKTSTVVKTWSEKPTSNNYAQNKLDLGKLKKGVYVLEAIKNGHINHLPIVVTEYGMINKRNGNELVSFVANKTTGEAMKGFEATMLINKEKVKPKKYNNGIALFDLDEAQATKYNQYIPIVAFKGDDIALTNNYFYNYSQKPIDFNRKYVFTDRSVYRPNQTVLFKGIVRKRDGFKFKISSDSVIYEIIDPQNKEVVKKQVAINKDGYFEDSVFFDGKAPLGEYKINVKFTNEMDDPHLRYWYTYYGKNSFNAKFKLEEYKKPEFEVTVELDKSEYVTGDKMDVEVSADYFFGAPVNVATVQYKVVRKQYQLPYWYNYRYSWWYSWYYPNYYNQTEEVLHYGEGELDKNGKFKFSVPTENPKQFNANYTVLATVTDASRRAISGSKSAIVAFTDFSLSAHSLKYYFDVDEEVIINAKTLNLSGGAVSKKVTATLRNGYNTNEKKILTKSQSTFESTGETEFKFDVNKAGYYSVEFESTDKRGNEQKQTVAFYVFDYKQNYYSWWQQNNGGGIQIFTNKQIYNAGETVEAMVYVPKEVDALVTLAGNHFADYQVEKFRSYSGNGSFKQIKFDIDPDAFGQLEVYVGFLKDGSFYNKQTNISIIPENRFLEVTVLFDESKYKPQTLAEATIKVVDCNGNPVRNADVSLATIDESIFSMAADNTKDIRQAFYPQENIVTYNNYSTNYNKYNYSSVLNANELLSRMMYRNMKFTNDVFIKNNTKYSIQYEDNKSNKTKLHGFVVSQSTNKLVPYAQVKIGGKTITTNQYGYYAMEGFTMSHTTIKASHAGVVTELKNIGLYKGKATYLNILLSEEDYAYDVTLHPVVRDLATDDELSLEDIAETEEEQVESLNEVVVTGAATRSVEKALSTNAVSLDAVSIKKAPRAKREAKGDNKNYYKGKDKFGGLAPKPMVEAKVRTQFEDAIYWNASVKTNAQGEAKVKIKLPDNLTTWRTTARVITPDSKVGQSLAKIIVTKDLLVRMETPRFITMGDNMLIATNIHNYLNTTKKVEVSIKSHGVSINGTKQTITVPPNGEKRIDWPMNAPWSTGQSELTVFALTNEESDAMEVKIPVIPYGLEMIHATTAAITNNGEQEFELQIPNNVDINTATVELSIDNSVTSALLTSMDELIGYPYGCVEQTMSRFLPNVIVSNTINEVGGVADAGINDAELAKMVAAGVDRLKQLQHKDGGWGWWSNDASHNYYTSYVMYGLTLAKRAGYPVYDDVYEKGKNAMIRQLTSQSNKDANHAYQMYVAMEMGLKDYWAKNKMMPTEKDIASTQAMWLMAAALAEDKTMSDVLVKRLEDMATDQNRFVSWGGQAYRYNWYSNNVETTANATRALLLADPDNSLITGAVQFLMNQRKGKAWHNTRETATVIYALQPLIKQEMNAAFDIEIWANNQLVETAKITKEESLKKGKTITLKGLQNYFVSVNPPLVLEEDRNVLQNGVNKIKLVQRGTGRSYINAKLNYYLDNDEIPASVEKNQAFDVNRTYYKLIKQFDKDNKLTYKKVPLKMDNIKSGDEVLVKVSVKNVSAQNHILIEDPIPAGCEFIKEPIGYLIDGESDYNGQNNWWDQKAWGYWNWKWWYTHREYRDNKMAMTITNMGNGTYEYTYLMRAQIPGTFNINPAVAQLMYYPEVRGFSDFSAMTIKE